MSRAPPRTGGAVSTAEPREARRGSCRSPLRTRSGRQRHGARRRARRRVPGLRCGAVWEYCIARVQEMAALRPPQVPCQRGGGIECRQEGRCMRGTFLSAVGVVGLVLGAEAGARAIDQCAAVKLKAAAKKSPRISGAGPPGCVAVRSTPSAWRRPAGNSLPRGPGRKRRVTARWSESGPSSNA